MCVVMHDCVDGQLGICRWALGVLIYEMVAGYPPFYSENKVEMFKVHSKSAYVSGIPE